jgi:uncharacterized surface protein with fasciclin (FAS1) repeats
MAFGATLAQAGKQDIVDTAVANGQFKTLAAALNAAGLVNTLKGPGPFTSGDRQSGLAGRCGSRPRAG